MTPIGYATLYSSSPLDVTASVQDAQVEGGTVDVTGLLLENADHAQPTFDRA